VNISKVVRVLPALANPPAGFTIKHDTTESYASRVLAERPIFVCGFNSRVQKSWTPQVKIIRPVNSGKKKALSRSLRGDTHDAEPEFNHRSRDICFTRSDTRKTPFAPRYNDAVSPVSLQIRFANASEVLNLRHLVLRTGLARETAIFSGDDEPETRHLVAVVPSDGSIVGCASFVVRPFPNQPNVPAWQLRGMAVDPARQGCGIGGQLLAFGEDIVRKSSFPHLLWCNARTPAARFYEQNGWQRVGEEFDVEDAGPHVRMFKRLAVNPTR
jgi:GNAT superfamily N-acetyltransferase